MGFIEPSNGRLNLAAPLTRGRAFTALAEAFQLTAALPDTTVLNQYSDAGSLVGNLDTRRRRSSPQDF